MKDKMSYYETHAHYHHKKLRNKLNVLLPQLESADIGKIIEIPISLDSNAEVIQLKKEVNAMGYTDLFSFAVGVHPNCITWTTSVGHFLRTVHTCYPFLFSAPAFALV